jgi:hypothetical protein
MTLFFQEIHKLKDALFVPTLENRSFCNDYIRLRIPKERSKGFQDATNMYRRLLPGWESCKEREARQDRTDVILATFVAGKSFFCVVSKL